MSTKWCHQCGSEFIARVEVCPDCGIDLQLEPPGSSADRAGPSRSVDDDGDGDAGGEPRPGDNVVYELHEWSEEARAHLDQLLSSAAPLNPGEPPPVEEFFQGVEAGLGPLLTGRRNLEIKHVWQGTDLIVPYSEQERAEALIDQVELGVLLALDPDATKLGYDLSDLIDDQLDLIADGLLAAGIPHGFDDETGELVVHEDDEERVEAVLDAVDFPDALPVDDGADGGDQGHGNAGDADIDPLAAQETMSDLFVAADRLRKDARDPDGVLSLVASAARAAELPVPYGFSDDDWNAIVERARGVATLIAADDTDDEAIEEDADRLRTLLRHYV